MGFWQRFVGTKQEITQQDVNLLKSLHFQPTNDQFQLLLHALNDKRTGNQTEYEQTLIAKCKPADFERLNGLIKGFESRFNLGMVENRPDFSFSMLARDKAEWAKLIDFAEQSANSSISR